MGFQIPLLKREWCTFRNFRHLGRAAKNIKLQTAVGRHDICMYTAGATVSDAKVLCCQFGPLLSAQNTTK